MARLTLKNILTKNIEISSLISSIAGELNIQVYVIDEKGGLIFGNGIEESKMKWPVTLDENIIGWVKGEEKALIIANLINAFVAKESEKRKLGNEVLTLYQEVNLIFNFSERLAETIDTVNIASITLEEAMRMIKASGGIFVLWDEKTEQLQLLAESGIGIISDVHLNDRDHPIFKAALSGESAITNEAMSFVSPKNTIQTVNTVVFAALKVKHRIMGSIILYNLQTVQYAAVDLKFLVTLALQSSSAMETALLYEKNIREAKEREEAMRKIYQVTNKFVPHEFIGSLGHRFITDVKLGDLVEKIVTVLFSDIRDYTTLAEQMSPEENFRFVSSFNEMMGPIIRNHGGFINQYLGDAIMAIFPGGANSALQASIAMQNILQEFNELRKLEGKTSIQMGLGMHTGPLIMGITGDNERLDATTISDTVNTASRLESLTKYYKVNIIFSEETHQSIGDLTGFHIRKLGMVQLKGKHLPVTIYECFNGNPDHIIENKKNTLRGFDEGLSFYLNRSFEEASISFKNVIDQNPSDLTAKFFFDNAVRNLEKGVPDNWSGIEEMSSK